MRTGVAVSAFAHIALITIGLIGLNHVDQLQPQEIEAISVDLVPIEDIASIRVGSEQSKVIDTPAPAVVDTPVPATLAERTGNTEENQVKPEEAPKPSPAPTVKTAPEPIARPEPKVQPEPTPEPTPVPEPQPTKAAEPEPAPEQPVVEPVEATPELATAPVVDSPAPAAPKPALRTASVDKLRADYKKAQEQAAKNAADAAAKAKATEADKVADIINTETSRGGTTGAGGQASAGKPTGQAARLTQSELGALIAQMRACWNPTLAERSEGVVVRLLVSMNKNGTVAGTPQILTELTSPLLGLSARTAQRKVQACGPFALPADKYDHWQEIDVTLDASQAN